MNSNSRGVERGSSSSWEAFVVECHKNPISSLEQMHQMVDELNTKTLSTNYGFLLLPVVDNITSPNVAPYYNNGKEWVQPIKAEVTGPVVQELLNKLPLSVRTGQDESQEMYQIRLDDVNSLDHTMGSTTLLFFFLNCRNEGGKCYLLPDDPSSHQNYTVFQQMHAELFPQLTGSEGENR